MPTSQPSQILTEQPGKIISLTSNGTEWNVTIELLTRNPEWLPGVGNEPFFIDQNKSLTVKASQDTAFICVEHHRQIKIIGDQQHQAIY